MATTHHTAVIQASPARVYAALLDPALIPRWRVRLAFETADPRMPGEMRILDVLTRTR